MHRGRQNINQHLEMIMGKINFTQILSATLVLLSIIDIVGSIPIILQLREKGRHVDALKATIYSTLLMVGFYYGGYWLLRLIYWVP